MIGIGLIGLAIGQRVAAIVAPILNLLAIEGAGRLLLEDGGLLILE